MCGMHSNELNDAMIAAMHATPREVTTSPFGSSDEIGMLNLITSESRKRVMDRVDGSPVAGVEGVVSLGHELEQVCGPVGAGCGGHDGSSR